jgi:flagellar protein FliO/FliZ
VPLPLRFLAAVYTAITCVLVLAPAALAAAADKAADKAPPAQPSYGEDKAVDLPLDDSADHAQSTAAAGGTSLVRTLVGLAVVIGVIYGLYWVLKQVKASREERATGTSLSSAAVVPLGPNRSLHLIRAGRELVLVGVAEHGVTPIRTYSEREAEDLGLIADEAHQLPAGNGNGSGNGDGKAGPMTIGDVLAKLRAKTVRT